MTIFNIRVEVPASSPAAVVLNGLSDEGRARLLIQAAEKIGFENEQLQGSSRQQERGVSLADDRTLTPAEGFAGYVD